MRGATLIYALSALLWLVVLCLPQHAVAQALEAIQLNGTQERIAITPNALIADGQGDNLRVNTAADADGVRRLMSVRARERGSDPKWLVFALHNQTDKPITRWLTAARYDIIGSGVVWPDLDSEQIRAVTPSVGFVPQKVDNERADIFRVTIDPGQTVTYVAELANSRASRVYLWKPVAYELQVRDRRLFNGIMLGITGLLGVFLTAVFAANHKAIFPSAALVAWCVLGYLCVDFGFWHKLLQLRSEDNAVYRAATEAAMAASLAIFLYTFLRIGSWHGFLRMLALVWIVAALALVFVAVLDPRLASTFARLSFVALGGVGALLTLFLALRGQDRALSLIPTWILLLVWLFGAGATLTGQLNGDLVVSSLVAGLTLIVVLLGFTVTQFAFGAMEPMYGAAPSEQNLRSLALDGAGAAVWDWHARREEIKVSPLVEATLGLSAGELSTKLDDFIKYVHPSDQERLRVMLWSIQEQGQGVLRTDFRLRHADNSYRWFDLEAASVPTADRRSLRCVGLIRDVTDAKRAHERLLHDAVHDNLTGLPNRELFVDRLRVAMGRAQREPGVRPKIIFVDIDKFKSVNASYGLIVGDSLLLTLSKKLQALLDADDTLARIGGDQFAVLSVSDRSPQDVADLAEQMRRTIRTPIRIAGQDIVLTGAIGIAIHDETMPAHAEDNELLKEAEIAMYRAKRRGADQIELFRPDMRGAPDDRVVIESELRQAIERNQLKVLFQPIIHLPREELAGFEALVRWQHPQRGLLNPSDFIPVAEESDLIVKLGSHVLMRAIEQAAKWQRELPRSTNPLFVSVNVSSRQLFRQDLIQEIRHIAGRGIVPDGVLRLEITETLVMENPEQATEMLESLKRAGARLALDDFGTGYSSLTYLQRFPFDTIKIDRDLVLGLGSSDAGPAIIRSIVALAHELGKQVVAEGVELAEDASFLRSIGCEFAQGFYYGEPMSEREVSELLKIVRKSERKLHRRGFFRTKPAPDKPLPTVRERDPDEAPAQIAAPEAAAARANGRAVSQGEAGAPARQAAAQTRPMEQRSAGDAPPDRGHPDQVRPDRMPAGMAPARPSTGQRPDQTPEQAAARTDDRVPQQHQPDDRPTAPHFRSPGMRARRRGNEPVPPTQADGYSGANGRQQPVMNGARMPHEDHRSQPHGHGQQNMRSSPPSYTAPPRPDDVAHGDAGPPGQQKGDASQPHPPPLPNGGTPPLPHMIGGQGPAPRTQPPTLPHQQAATRGGAAPTGNEGHAGNGVPAGAAGRPLPVSLPDLSKLPPGIAASLGRLAGMSEQEIDEITGGGGARRRREPTETGNG